MDWLLSWANRFNSAVPVPARSAEARHKVLIVDAHPQATGYARALAAAAAEGCAEAGHEVRRVSLYSYGGEDPAAAAGLSAKLSAREHREYHGGAQAAALADPSVATAVAALRWCDSLVFVYPTWWFNTPAAVKGFVDRAFLPGVAFALEDGGTLKPLLTNIRRVAGVSTYGAPQAVVAAAGDNGRTMISHALRPMFAPSCTLRWLGLYEMDTQQRPALEAHVAEVRRTFRDEF